MLVQIQSIHFEADEKLLKATTEKLRKLGKFFDRIEKCDVVLTMEKDDRRKGHVVDVRLVIPKDDVFASQRAETFERALELVFAELKKQLLKRKDKMREPRGFREKLSKV